jgi:chromosome segregation ATPase
MNSTATSNSRKKAEPSGSQKKSEPEVPVRETVSRSEELLPSGRTSDWTDFTAANERERKESLPKTPKEELALSPNEKPAWAYDPAKNAAQKLSAAQSGITSDERELGPKDEEKEEDLKSLAVSLTDSEILPQESITAQSVQTSDEPKVGPKDEENQSPTSDRSSDFLDSPLSTLGPEEEAALEFPADFDPLIGPFTDTTPAHVAEPPLLLEEGDWDPEKGFAVDSEEGLYDAFGPSSPVQSQPEPELQLESTLTTPDSQSESEPEPESTVITPEVQSQLESETEEFESQNTSTTPTPQSQSEPTRPESTIIFTPPQWHLGPELEIEVSEPQRVSVTSAPEHEPQVEAQVRDEAKSTPDLPPRPSGATVSVPTDTSPANLPVGVEERAVDLGADEDISKDHPEVLYSHRDIPSTSTAEVEPTALSLAAQNSAEAVSLMQGQRRPSQGNGPRLDVEPPRRKTQQVVDFEAYAADPANTDKDCAKMAKLAQLAIDSLNSDFYNTIMTLEENNAWLASGTDRGMQILGEFVQRDAVYSTEIERQRRKSEAVLHENGELKSQTEDLAEAFDTVVAGSVGTITPAECEIRWISEREELKLDIKELIDKLAGTQALLEVAPKTEEMEELQQKVKDLEDITKITGDGDANQQNGNLRAEMGRLRRELQKAEPSDADTLDQMRAQRETDEKSIRALQDRLKTANEGYEGVSKQRDTLQATVESVKELMTAENQKHTEDRHELENQIADLKFTNETNIGDIATFGATISNLRSKLTKVTQERDENQDTIKDLEANIPKLQEQIDRNDKTLTEQECSSRNAVERNGHNSDKEHLRDALKIARLENEKLKGELKGLQNENHQLENQVNAYAEEENSKMITRTECDDKYAAIKAESQKNETELHVTKCIIDSMTRDEMEHIREAKTATSPQSPVFTESASLTEAISRLNVLVMHDRRQSVDDVKTVRKQSVDITNQLQAEIVSLTVDRDHFMYKYNALEKSVEDPASGSFIKQIASSQARILEKEKELQELKDFYADPIADHAALTKAIAENSHKCDVDKAKLVSQLAEAIEKKAESDREHTASLEAIASKFLIHLEGE